MSNRTIEIIVDVRDQTGGKVKGLADDLKKLDAAAQRINNRIRAIGLQRFATTIRLIDRVTEPGTRINALLKRIAGTTYRVTMNLNESVLGKIRQVEAAVMRLTSKAYTIAINVKDNVKSKLGGLMSGAAMGAGVFMPMAGMAGVGFGVANAIQASAGFEQQMSKVQAIRQLSKDSAEMKALTQQAKDLGMQTAWTRQQVGEAQYYQALAGWSTQNILQATPHLLNMASAGGMDLGRASDIVTDAMTAFGLKATEMYTNKQGQQVSATEHFIDMLTKLQASANTDISQAGEAFKYSANVIGSMFSGQNIERRMQATEDAMIMTGLMANAGIKGSMAGTATRAVFTRMASMNRNSYNALRAMGVEYKDDNGNILMPGEILRGLSKRFKEGVDPNQLLEFAETIAGEKIHADTRRKLDTFIEQTQKNGGKMGSADMAKMAAMLAGQEAMSGLLAVLMGDWDKMAEKMDNVNGTAKDMADTMLENLAGSFTRLGSAWDAFQQDLFTGTAGDGLRGFVDTLTEVLTRANKLFQDGIHIGDFGKIIADVIDRLKNKFLEFDGIGSILAGGALAAGLMKIISLSQRALTALRNVGKAGAWGTAAAGTRGVAGAQAVGTMNVSAGVVNINGRVNGAIGGRKVGNAAIIDNYNRTKERIRGATPPTVIPPTAAPPTPSRFAGMRSAAGGAAAFAGLFSVMDMMSLKAANAERLAAAPTEQRAQIAIENRKAEFEAGAGAAGSIFGAAAGAALGSTMGPLGTMLGGMIGSIAGETLGKILGKDADIKSTVDESNRWNLKRGTSEDYATTGTDSAEVLQGKIAAFSERAVKVWNGTLEQETEQIADIGAQVAARRKTQAAALMAQYQAETQAATATRDRLIEFANIRKNIEADIGQAAKEQKFLQQNDDTFDYYRRQREYMMLNPQDFYGTKDLWGGSRAEAAELSPEQQMQQAAMERGEFYQQGEMPAALETPEAPLDLTGVTEQLYSDLEALQQGVTELFSGFGESITEQLTSAFEGAGEIFSTFGQSVTEGLTSTFENAGTMLENFGTQITAGMESAQTAAVASLTTIQTAFTTTRDQIQSSWGELPGFFSGIFSGLGGAAAAAGAAIAAGLTAPIGSVIAAWQSAAAQISSIISSISASSAAVGAGGVGKAEGGFVSSETHYFAGEHGPEVIIPLGSSHRARAMDLLEKTAAILGGENVTFGADELQSTVGEGLKDLGAPVPTIEADTPVNQVGSSNISTNSSGGQQISISGLSLNFEFGSVVQDATDFISQIRDNSKQISDMVASCLAQSIDDINKNQPLLA